MRLAPLVIAAAVLFGGLFACGGVRAAGQDEDGCFTGKCHQALAAYIAQAKTTHAPLRGERRCTPCHAPHGETPPVCRSPSEIEALCAGCHIEMGLKLRDSRHRHTALDRTGCVACHLPHGGEFTKLLKNVVFVTEWEGPLYVPHLDVTNLCWQCHDRRLKYEKTAGDVTRFRDGDRNLHEQHVSDKKGRSCKACHDTHAADQSFHIRPDVPFGTGGWKLPVRYTQTKDGGSCEVGCHRPQSYRRTTPQETGGPLRPGLDAPGPPAPASPRVSFQVEEHYLAPAADGDPLPTDDDLLDRVLPPLLKRRQAERALEPRAGETRRDSSRKDLAGVRGILPFELGGRKMELLLRAAADPSMAVLRGRFAVLEDGRPVYELAVPVTPAESLNAFYPWGRDWVLELDDRIVVSGADLNEKHGYAASFFHRIVAGAALYFFVKDGLTRISYNGVVLPNAYEEVLHGWCCEPSRFNPDSSERMIWFFARRGGAWYYCEAGVFE